MQVALFKSVTSREPWVQLDTDLGNLADTPRSVPYDTEQLEALDDIEYAKAKDVGFFILGTVDGRQAVDRSGIALDFDSEDAVRAWENAKADFEWWAYPTLSSGRRGNGRRWRVLVPLVESIPSGDYTAKATALVESLGLLHVVDRSCLRPNQPMFLPARALGEEWRSIHHPGPIVDLDALPPAPPVESSGLPDPRQKGGIIGAFNTAYSVEQAILAFDLPYDPGDGGAWSYRPAKSRNGLKIYDDGLYAFSNHQSDPACDDHCKSAFDLLAAHRGFDRAMQLARDDSRVTVEKVRAIVEWGEAVEAGDSSVVRPNMELAISARGNILKNIDNVYRVIKNEGFLDGVWYDSRTLTIWCDSLRWRKTGYDRSFTEQDMAQLCRSVEQSMQGQSVPRAMVESAMHIWLQENARNPLLDKLSSLTWDGENRMDRLFVDCLRAEDSDVVRAMTRAWLIGAVKRAYEPGSKMDSMIVLQGEEGIGKTWICERLAFGTDSGWLATGLKQLDDKDTHMIIARAWLVELGELSALRRTERESAKQFLTETVSHFRPPYGRHVIDVPRSCVFIGQTNESTFLDPEPGNRRYWVVPCESFKNDSYALQAKDDAYFEQIWAEAVQAYLRGEPSRLEGQMIADAAAMADQVTDHDELTPQLLQFLRNHERKEVCMSELGQALFMNQRLTPIQRRRIRVAISHVKGWVLASSKEFIDCACGLPVKEVWRHV